MILCTARNLRSYCKYRFEAAQAGILRTNRQRATGLFRKEAERLISGDRRTWSAPVRMQPPTEGSCVRPTSFKGQFRAERLTSTGSSQCATPGN